jgi:hypothetical protein
MKPFPSNIMKSTTLNKLDLSQVAVKISARNLLEFSCPIIDFSLPEMSLEFLLEIILEQNVASMNFEFERIDIL